MVAGFVDFLIQQGMLDKTDREASVYGLTLLFEKTVTYLLLMGIALFLGKPIEGIVFAVCFVLLRQTTGGFHAETFPGCLAGSALSFYFAVEIMVAWLQCHLWISNGLLLMAVICVWVWAPVNHPNLLLTKDEIKKNRLWSRCVLLIEGSFIVLGYVLHRQWQQYIVSAVILCAVFMLIAKLIGQEVRDNEEK